MATKYTYEIIDILHILFFNYYFICTKDLRKSPISQILENYCQQIKLVRTGLLQFSDANAINRYIGSAYIEEIKLIPIINERSDIRSLAMLCSVQITD